MDVKEEILYVGDENKNIFFLDKDVDLLKKLGGTLLESYPSYQVIASDNLEDIKDELRENKPSLFILEISVENSIEIIEFIRNLRDDDLIKDVPVIALGTRDILENNSYELEKLKVHNVPKAVRVPYFMGTVQTCLNSASSMELKSISLAQGENLFLEGDSANCFYIIKSGQLEIFRKQDGEVFVLGVAKEFEIIGEMALLNKRERSAGARAKEASVVLELSLQNMESYLNHQPFWLRLMIKALMERLDKANKLNSKN